MSDLIHPKDWYSALPRGAYQAYDRILCSNDAGWYEVYRVLPDVYALYEPGHAEEVISYLILGADRSLLWDTGMGIVPIRPLVEELTRLPCIVANSHNHHDHVGGNWEFPQVYGWPSEALSDTFLEERSDAAQTPESRAEAGYSHSFLAPMMGAPSLAKPLPEGFDVATYSIRPWQAALLPRLSRRAPDTPASHSFILDPSQADSAGYRSDLQDGSFPRSAAYLCTGFTFDLGGRLLEVLATPGHSPDSIMLLDRANGILFTGDTVYPAALYAHFDSAEYGKSSLPGYARTMQALCGLEPVLTSLCCSHNVPVNPPSLLSGVASGFSQILSGSCRGIPQEGGLAYYPFDGFSIVTPL
ncbi:MAG: MBL fold metallo-hydrolase [Clostridiales bacterium]|nr:MBL fold metallo-hydrolase [Clostridiales bacterium]